MKEISSYNVHSEFKTFISQIDTWSELYTRINGSYSKLIWVIDRNLVKRLPVDQLDNVIVLGGGDTVKGMEGFKDIIDHFVNYGLDRKGHVVVIGGGSLSDLVGFAASVYLRGVSFSIIPSTLLGLIDASIGGKNGINFRQFKNQIGTFYQPSHVYFLPEIIDQLPPEEMADGFAEIIKYGLIQDSNLFQILLGSNLESILADKKVLNEIIYRCIIHKSNVVNKDPFDANERRILNFGHTIGHAIESLYGYSHGKAVGLGMLFAAKMSENYYELDTSISQVIRKVLNQFALPIRLENFSAETIFNKIKADKKREDNNIFFILIDKIGKANIEKLAMEELMDYLIKAEKEGWMS